MTTRQYNEVLSNESIEWFITRPEVAAAKARILEKSATTNYIYGGVSEYFTVPLTSTIRSELFEKMGLQLTHASSLPMRWIIGDTPAHHDSGIADLHIHI
jgi:hypothetical protein